MGIQLKSKYKGNHTWCPHCKGSDIRGPIDTDPVQPHMHFTRSWFCRTCWWDTSVKLRDDTATPEQPHGAARHVAS